MKRIRIGIPSVGEIYAELSETSITAQKIWEALPIEARVNTWGEEIYFHMPVEIEVENPKEVVQPGDLGFWPPGNAFCVFFGPTPASRGGEIRPASPVNVFGRVVGDPKILKRVRSEEWVRVERA